MKRRTFTLQMHDRPEPHYHTCMRCGHSEPHHRADCPANAMVTVCPRCPER